jgi:hypothetical protein
LQLTSHAESGRLALAADKSRHSLKSDRSSKVGLTGQTLPIFPSGVWELFYLGEDFGESVGEPFEVSLCVTDGERATEHLHEMLGGNQGVDNALNAWV